LKRAIGARLLFYTTGVDACAHVWKFYGAHPQQIIRLTGWHIRVYDESLNIKAFAVIALLLSRRLLMN